MNDELIKKIVDARDYKKMVPIGEHPMPGEYVITGLQVGNHNGERGWDKYVGYVVQVRKEAGCFCSDLILIRHPDGKLTSHENQSFFRVNKFWKEKIKSLYNEDDVEDYSKPYTLGMNGEYPEIGKIIEPKKDGYHGANKGPFTMITIDHGDGTKTVEAIV